MTGGHGGAEPNGGPALHREAVRPEWIDYNGHMNLAYYLLAFDHATDALQDVVGLDAGYREATGGSVFVAEAHLTYASEVMPGEEIRIRTRVLDVDGKRLHLFHEMFAGPENAQEPGRLAATSELMILHVDLADRRTTPFPARVRERLEGMKAAQSAVPPPPQAGRRIEMKKKI
ncbi:MAG: thioesterase-like protein [Rhodospirillales bacterium CG15_BIG_FIL_POST_REV_8_21_14_020_66_15]|nr:MAG: thioesterase-like protein [Rhodospirillales bacterium CG15_BIG_FIL_POST_REV_8_21_14_020_66_15]